MATGADEFPTAEVNDETYQLAVHAHARYLGMDPEQDSHYLWLAAEALTADLPPEWEQGTAPDGNVYYFNNVTVCPFPGSGWRVRCSETDEEGGTTPTPRIRPFLLPPTPALLLNLALTVRSRP